MWVLFYLDCAVWNIPCVSLQKALLVPLSSRTCVTSTWGGVVITSVSCSPYSPSWGQPLCIGSSCQTSSTTQSLSSTVGTRILQQSNRLTVTTNICSISLWHVAAMSLKLLLRKLFLKLLIRKNFLCLYCYSSIIN